MMGKADNFELHNEINTLKVALLDVMRQLDDQQSHDDNTHWNKYGYLVKEKETNFKIGDRVVIHTDTHMMNGATGTVQSIDSDEAIVYFDLSGSKFSKTRFNVHPSQLSLAVSE